MTDWKVTGLDFFTLNLFSLASFDYGLRPPLRMPAAYFISRFHEPFVPASQFDAGRPSLPE